MGTLKPKPCFWKDKNKESKGRGKDWGLGPLPGA